MLEFFCLLSVESSKKLKTKNNNLHSLHSMMEEDCSSLSLSNLLFARFNTQVCLKRNRFKWKHTEGATICPPFIGCE